MLLDTLRREIVVPVVVLTWVPFGVGYADPLRGAASQIPLSLAASSYLSNAVSATDALQKWYNRTTGLWDTTGWWNSANCITSLADLTRIEPDVDIVTSDVFSNTYDRAPKVTLNQGRVTTVERCTAKTCPQRVRRAIKAVKPTNFLNDYYDDEGWWAIAWIKVYDLTRDHKYLQTASDIFDDMVATGYNATCGGLWWRKEKDANVAIANELFLHLAAALANRKPNKSYYIQWATRHWAWFLGSGLINADGTVNDGLDLSTCKNNGGIVWSYNQGVILSALVELNIAQSNATYIDTARKIATAAIAKLAQPDGVLHDPREPDLGGDGQQFKGVFMRGLRDLYSARPSSNWKTFLEKNADTIWSKNRGNDTNLLGPVWSGPFYSSGPYQATAATQSSALDALIGAAAAQSG